MWTVVAGAETVLEQTEHGMMGAHTAVVPIMGAVGMTGKVIVQRAGAKLQKTPEQVTAASDAAIKSDIMAAQAADAAARKVTSRPGANGSTIYTVTIGGVTPTGGELLRFGSSDHAPHTVSFFSGGAETPETIKVGDSTYCNPAAMAAVGGSTYDGTGVANSGFLWGTKDPISGPRKYSLTFTKPGHFEYVCIPHDDMGMMACITVTQ
jgi:plastocyanin